ncbi:hypothetical protein EYC80_009377 [Monilinia laxa]|uniref:Uncharacterized protein n=1 Tax=Monilinia laxa TaxID=61186 RepID=A0A5N6JXL8_MONLA|nr:hypothetical protein EYC80_009377 [Monilinia laxa]
MRFYPVTITSCVALVAAIPAIPPISTTSLSVELSLATTPPVGLPLSTTLPIPIPLPTPAISSYSQLNNFCLNVGPDTYVAVQYANGVITSYNYGDCYPYNLNGSAVAYGVFYKSVLCRNCLGENCANPIPLDVLVPKSVAVINPIPFVTNLLGKGAICRRPKIGLPFLSG